MTGFKIEIFDQIWTRGFQFDGDPSIEIKRDTNTNTIYEKPNFSFVAKGELFQAFEVQDFCLSIPIKIIKDEETIYNGNIRLSDIETVYHDPQLGSYKNVEVIDDNYNFWFKTNENVEVDLETYYDRDCNRISPPTKQIVKMYEPWRGNGVNNHPFDRWLYNFYDAIKFVVLVISDNNVTVVSEFFEKEQGKNWFIGSGDQIKYEFGVYSPKMTWSSISTFLRNTYRLHFHHYEFENRQYVRIDTYEYFFDATQIIKYDAVSSARYSINPEKLYSTLRIGDNRKPDRNAYTSSFINYDAFSFGDYQLPILQRCSNGTELSLVNSEISVSTVLIEYLLAQSFGRTDVNDTYDEDTFLIEFSEQDVTTGFGNRWCASLWGIKNAWYYNNDFLNSSIIRRHFNGQTPYTIYPEDFDNLNYFVARQGEASIAYKIGTGGTPQTVKGFVKYEGQIREYNPDDVLRSWQQVNTIVPPVGAGGVQADMMYFTCTKSGEYTFDFNWNVSMFGGWNGWNLDPTMGGLEQIRVYIRIDIRGAGADWGDSTPTIQQIYEPGGAIVTDGLLGKATNYEYTSPPITLSAGEKVAFSLESDWIPDIVFSLLGFAILPNSVTSVIPCPAFQGGENVWGLQEIHNITFEGYPLKKSDFERIRNTPGVAQRLLTYQKDTYEFRGSLEMVQYNYARGIANVALVNDKGLINYSLIEQRVECLFNDVFCNGNFEGDIFNDISCVWELGWIFAAPTSITFDPLVITNFPFKGWWIKNETAAQFIDGDYELTFDYIKTYIQGTGSKILRVYVNGLGASGLIWTEGEALPKTVTLTSQATNDIWIFLDSDNGTAEYEVQINNIQLCKIPDEGELPLCWVLYDTFWHDECIWIDSEIWDEVP